jgi:hypothetical protein
MRQIMTKMTKTAILAFAGAALLFVPIDAAQKGAENREWRHYGGDAGGTK